MEVDFPVFLDGFKMRSVGSYIDWGVSLVHLEYLAVKSDDAAVDDDHCYLIKSVLDSVWNVALEVSKASLYLKSAVECDDDSCGWSVDLTVAAAAAVVMYEIHLMMELTREVDLTWHLWLVDLNNGLNDSVCLAVFEGNDVQHLSCYFLSCSSLRAVAVAVNDLTWNSDLNCEMNLMN